MKKYKLIFSKIFLKELKKIDAHEAKIILRWLKKRIENTENPRTYGKLLKGSLRDFYSYRIGQYRVLCSIDDSECVILAFSVGHRKNIYNK